MRSGNLRVKQMSIPNGVGLGLRWSFLQNVVEGQAEGKVAFFEISPENYMRRGGYFPHALEQVANRHSLSTHGLSMSLGGTDDFDPRYFGELRSFLDRIKSPWHSDHLSFGSSQGAAFHDLLPIPFNRSCADRIVDRLLFAQDRVGRRMLVENISYYLKVGEDDLEETEFITRILEKSDSGLLLDLNNLDVNAKNHSFDAYRWLDAIPLDRVREIHVAGPEAWDDGLLLDTHGSPVRSDVFALLSWVIERVGPKPVLLERDNNVPELSVLLEEVQQIDRVYQRAIAKWRQGKVLSDVA